MIPLLGLLAAPEVGFQILLGKVRRAVDPLQHGPPGVPPPVRPCGVQQLEMPHVAGAGHVGTPAQVHEGTVGIDRDHLVVAQLLQALQLQGVVFEAPPRLLPVHLFAHKGIIGLDDLPHALLDRRQVLRGEGPGHVEIVVETVLNGRAESDPRSREQLPHRRGQHMSRGVAQGIERLGRAGREDLHRRVRRNGAVQVPDLAVHLGGYRLPSQPRAQRLRQRSGRGAGRHRAHRAVRQGDANLVTRSSGLRHLRHTDRAVGFV